MREHVILLIFCLFVCFFLFGLLESDGWSWRSQQRPRQAIGHGGHIFDEARRYKEDSFLPSWRAPRKSYSILFQLTFLIYFHELRRIILSAMVVSM